MGHEQQHHGDYQKHPRQKRQLSFCNLLYRRDQGGKQDGNDAGRPSLSPSCSVWGRGWPAAIGTARRKPELQVRLHLHPGLTFDHILAFFKPFFPFLRSFPFLQVFVGVETEYYDVSRTLAGTKGLLLAPDNVYVHEALKPPHGLVDHIPSIHSLLKLPYPALLGNSSYGYSR
jgi:hypothetical protein